MIAIPSFLQPLYGFVERSLPSPDLVARLGPPLLIGALVAATIAGALKARAGMRTPYTRKIFHFMIFTTSSLLQLKLGLPAVMLFGVIVSAIVLFGVWRGDGFAFYEALARPTDAPRRSLFIIVPLVTTALGGVLSNLLFGPYFAPVGYMVGGWGDAVGEPVGTRFGKHRYKVPSLAGVAATRSLEGSAAVFLMGVTAATLVLAVSGVRLPLALGVGLACGAAGALVEAFSSHGLDNLTVQVAAAAMAWALLA